MCESIYGSFFSYISNFFGCTKQCKILMLGLNGGVGKTTLLYRIKNGHSNDKFIPTIGFNIEDIKYNDNTVFRYIDVGGGGGRLHSIWYHYYEQDLNVLIYVIDGSYRERLDEALDILTNFVLNHPNLPKETIIQILINKNDIPNSISVQEIKDREVFVNLNNRKLNIQSISAINGNGINESLKWIYENIQNKN